MNKNTLELRPLPLVGWWMLTAAGILEPEIYRYHEDRWYLRDESAYPDAEEYMLIELEDGAMMLVNNSF